MKVTPSIGIAAILAGGSFHYASVGYLGYDPDERAATLIWYASDFMIVWWAYADAKKIRFHRPYEFGALTLYFLPIVLPAYLVATRGWKGLLIAGGLYSLLYVPIGIGWLAYYANPANP